MSLPTRDQLHEEVDRRFADQFPDAPTRLDPDDPDQASWIDSWLAIRDEILNDWVDEVFARFFPGAGKLDPDDPADSTLIDYWIDIRDQIRDGSPGQWSWDGDPTARAQLGVQSVEHDPAGGWVVTFDREASVDEAQAFLWRGGTPAGVRVESRSTSSVHLSGLSIEAMQAMTPEVSRQIKPDVLTADPPAGEGTTSTSPDVDVELDAETEAKISEWTKHALEGTHVLASTAEVAEYLTEAAATIAGHATKVATVAKVAGAVSKVLGPIGHVAMIITIAWEVIDAFKSERRGSVRQGFVYGVMWESLGEPDHLPKFEPGITYSAEEHEEAFKAGIAEGRAKAKDPKLRNQIILAVATLSLSSGYGDYYAANEVLSQLWRAYREPSPGASDTDTIRWPVPYDRNPLVMQ
ncbi:MAG: hypothetical protein ACR2FP_03435 [Nocardioidaceae bacterium]